MRPVVYIVLAAIALIAFKAFFLDEYLAEKKTAQTNTAESDAAAPKEDTSMDAKPVSVLKAKEPSGSDQNASNEKPRPSYSDMPLEKVGNKIAEKIEGHL